MIRDTESDKYRQYYRIQMQKEMILEKMGETGCRITKQRITILDIILSEKCSSCKEIYYLAIKEDPSIGTATVYRIVNLLEEIGAFSSRKRYEITYSPEIKERTFCIQMDDHSVVKLSDGELRSVIREGMRACGYLEDGNVTGITLEDREDTE